QFDHHSVIAQPMAAGDAGHLPRCRLGKGHTAADLFLRLHCTSLHHFGAYLHHTDFLSLSPMTHVTDFPTHFVHTFPSIWGRGDVCWLPANPHLPCPTRISADL